MPWSTLIERRRCECRYRLVASDHTEFGCAGYHIVRVRPFGLGQSERERNDMLSMSRLGPHGHGIAEHRCDAPAERRPVAHQPAPLLELPFPGGRWWRGLDLNQRRLSPTDLQSVPFSHSGTPPCGTAPLGPTGPVVNEPGQPHCCRNPLSCEVGEGRGGGATTGFATFPRPTACRSSHRIYCPRPDQRPVPPLLQCVRDPAHRPPDRKQREGSTGGQP
jgi:hypothetical protein